MKYYIFINNLILCSSVKINIGDIVWNFDKIREF